MIEVGYVNHMGSDLSVVNAARVSFGKKKYYMDEKDEKLIRYLAKHKHISPFGHCFASFHVSAPIFVARQLVKHKFLRWNEISRRYVDYTPKLYEPDEWRGRSQDKKQGSSGTVRGLDIYEVGLTSIKCYENLLDAGVAPEQARMVLPQNTMTEWYWSGSLDAFADMCNLRCAEDTQLESRLVANKIDEHMERQFPVSWKALRGK